MAGIALTKDEVRTLLATDPASEAEDDGRGFWSTLFLPHPKTRGGGRIAELALTVAALPLVVAGVVGIGLFTMRRRRYRAQLLASARGEATVALMMSTFGTLTLFGFAPVSLVLAGNVAVWARAAVRGHAATERTRVLMRLAEPAAPERLPRPSAPVVKVPGKAPDVDAPTPLDQGPRLLR
jgi:hypothetical protein